MAIREIRYEKNCDCLVSVGGLPLRRAVGCLRRQEPELVQLCWGRKSEVGPPGPSALNRIRFVYNGIYDEKIRTYNVRELPGIRGAAFMAFARGYGDFTQEYR